MKAKCAVCGLDWIISIRTKIGKNGYECPWCEYRRLLGLPVRKREERK